ncbi:hypothetical protein GIB67_041369, partial [Kingdonia uniflora]
MHVHGTFTTVFKVWKDIATLPTVRDAVVNIYGQFMDIRLGNSDNRLTQALTKRWWPTTHTFLFPCAEIGVTPLDFTMLTSLSIGRYLTQVPYDDAWSILSNARQLLPNIDSSHIKCGNVSIAHLKTYLTVEIHREDDITIARAFILFMMGYLWFQTAKDTVLLGYFTAVNDLDSAAQYDWGSAILASLYHGLDTANRDEIQCRGSLDKNTENDSIPYDPSQEIIEFLQYDREFYQRLKELDFYDGHNYIIAEVDYIRYWHLAHPNPKIGCSLMKKAENIWMVRRDLVSLDAALSPTSSLATSSQVQNYGVEAYGEEV